MKKIFLIYIIIGRFKAIWFYTLLIKYILMIHACLAFILSIFLIKYSNRKIIKYQQTIYGI